MSAVVIQLGNKSKTLKTGETYTFNCADQILSWTNDLSITFKSDGWFTYNGLTTVGRGGLTRKLVCAGKMMASNIVITAGKYGGDSSSSHPTAIHSENEMVALLTNATPSSIGAVYKYMGEPSSIFSYGELYIISEDS